MRTRQESSCMTPAPTGSGTSGERLAAAATPTAGRLMPEFWSYHTFSFQTQNERPPSNWIRWPATLLCSTAVLARKFREAAANRESQVVHSCSTFRLYEMWARIAIGSEQATMPPLVATFQRHLSAENPTTPFTISVTPPASGSRRFCLVSTSTIPCGSIRQIRRP